MAAVPTVLHCNAYFIRHRTHSIPVVVPAAKLGFGGSVCRQNLTRGVHFLPNSNSVWAGRYLFVVNAFQQSQEDCCEAGNELRSSRLRRLVRFIRDMFPGGNWWSLSPFEQKLGGYPTRSESTTVFQVLSQMWALLADEKWILYAAFGALAVTALSEISMPGILTAAVFSAQNGETLVFYQHTRFLILLCFTSGIFSGLRTGCFAIANTILVKRLRKTLYSSLLLQDISFFNTEAVGDLTSRLSTDCQRLSRTVGYDMYLILRNIIQGTGAFINLMTLSWPLAMSSLIICFILSAVFVIYGRYQKKVALLAQDFVASANEVAQETFSLMRTIRAYGTERKEFQRFSQWLDGLASVSLRESLAYGFWNLSFLTLYRLTQVFAVLLGGMSVLAGSASAEQLTKYVLYCEWLIYATWRLQDSMSSLYQSIGACEKVFQLMHLPPSFQFTSEGVTMKSLSGSVDFVNVSFHYPSRIKVPILENMNFSLQANEVVAIVGANGSGKSTLINLLLRLYEPSCGEILIDSIPLKVFDIQWLRKQIGFVEQEPNLFHLDVKSNISYGCFQSITQEDIEHAAKNAHAHEFISALPRGYDTVIDDNLLSGGQKQRIAIARAVLRDPAILILDEATSALDAESEGYIQEILLSLKKDRKRQRTIIIIAHRLTTIKAADRILVMNEGRVVEVGNHEELQLFTMQQDVSGREEGRVG
ncbi:ABC transporter B family member 26, chloroplastic-like isoform X2 [Andrographis paniculata]|uniref:ABC transporter B family member 26, chloroplastic-like isoform X2 n=1 Tax=Andrographis paniculata TaxID=175694 RepID=UPI0021E7E410|nr:ABC transporter B family member 26, chloroplastic-like isoform X2 [Andrographis paniculata]